MVAFREAQIRIVGVPAGEAPLSIREQWVGLVLPLAHGETGPSRLVTSGVLTGTVADEAGSLGYVVEIEEAMRVLAQKAPQAAAWWRRSAPHLFTPGGTLVFDWAACALVA